MGYHRAGFEVVGVDIEPQPHFPFEFHQGDAMTFPLDGFDAIHASPPCQAFTQFNGKFRGESGRMESLPDLLSPTRERFAGLSMPWVIENVVGARDHMQTTILLHGGMFGLGVDRTRRFESNVLLMAIEGPRTVEPIGVYDKLIGDRKYSMRNNGGPRADGTYSGKSPIRLARTMEEAEAAMGIDWMTWNELKEAIPPAYTEWIGTQLLAAIEVAA
jgi:DNA (cytosine-5)-methyltransferase 1